MLPKYSARFWPESGFVGVSMPVEIPHYSGRKIPPTGEYEFTVATRCFKMKPAGEAEAGNAGVQPTEE
jgi:hypothetical protein